MDLIKPCPFCGCSASVEEVEGGADPVRFSVGCDNGDEADCMGYQSLTTFARRSDAISAWNKRAEPPLPVEPPGHPVIRAPDTRKSFP